MQDTCKVGFFSIGLDTYWGQFKGLKENLLGYHAQNAWSKAGPAHHCAIGVGHIACKIEKLAELLKIEVQKVC